MGTVFGALDATDESERRVPSVGSPWSLIQDVRREMARDLSSGKWNPIEEDRRRAADREAR